MTDLTSIAEEVTACTRCGLCSTRTKSVPGEGNPNADVMFIGEGPGENEDKQGRPFVGRAGAILDRIIKNCLDLEREDVYITNVVKCRPPSNRDPSLIETMQCSGYLDEQIALVNPKVIVSLGKVATYHMSSAACFYKEPMSFFRARNSSQGHHQTSIPRLTGSRYTGEDVTFPLVATWHPAYILRQGINSEVAWQVKEDMDIVNEILRS